MRETNRTAVDGYVEQGSRRRRVYLRPHEQTCLRVTGSAYGGQRDIGDGSVALSRGISSTCELDRCRRQLATRNRLGANCGFDDPGRYREGVASLLAYTE